MSINVPRRLLGVFRRVANAAGNKIVSLSNPRVPTDRFAAIGEGCEIAPSVEITSPERFVLGSHVFINRDCHLATEGGLTIESHSILGPWVLVMTSMHAYRGARLLPYDERDLIKPVVIGRASWIGARAILLPGVKLGAACVVGAGSVVTKSWPDGTVIAGNPAREIARREPEELASLLASEAFYLREKQRVGLKKRFISG